MNLKAFFATTGLALMAVATTAEPVVFYAPHGSGLEIRDTSEKTLPVGPPTEVLTTNGITFNLYYEDIINNTNAGFDSPTDGPNARARVNDTLTYLASVLNESGTLDILFSESSNNPGSGALAAAGTYYPLADGFFGGSTLARLHDPGDAKPFAGIEEIGVTVNFGANWNFSSAPAVSPKYDLQTVLLHEFTHGLGFASLTDSTGASRFFTQFNVKTHTVYDTLLRRRSGNVALFNGLPPALQVAVSTLTSGGLAFGGTEAIQAYQPNPAPGIYAPASFSQGSSLSHWDTNNIVGGAVMEHAISSGENRRTFSPVDLGALRDIGYLDASDEPALNCDLNACPDFNAQGTQLYAQLAILLSQPLDFASTDIDGTGIPDRYEVALLQRLLCTDTTSFGSAPICTFNANLATLEDEGIFPVVSATPDIAAGLLTISSELQGSIGGLTGDYEAFVAPGAKAVGETLAPQGDPDSDGVSNLQEYLNTIADGGSVEDYVNAALNPLTDGSASTSLPVGSTVALGGLLVALGALSVTRLRKTTRA